MQYFKNYNFPVLEWLKWLSYKPELEQEQNQSLVFRTLRDFKRNDVIEFEKYKEQIRILPLLEKYYKGTCTIEEYRYVFSYIMHESIEELMLNKLSREELIEAKVKLKQLKLKPVEILKEKVSLETTLDVYETLSKVDAYVLHVIANINFDKPIKEIEEDIDSYIR